MKYMLLFILHIILCNVFLHMTSRTEAYVHPRTINQTILSTREMRPLVRVHPARRCYDDCSLIEFKGNY